MNLVPRSLLLCALALALAACQRDAQPAASPSAAPGDAAAPAQAPTPPIELKDVIETNDRYIVGISYPKDLANHPGLASILHDYAQSARDELIEAAEGLGNDKPTAPYELSLNFEKVIDTPRLVAVAADGSRYTGGAHGQPLIARFVWLPEKNHLLRAQELIPQPAGWQAISDFVGEQLMTAVALRADADALPPVERADVLKGAAKMIDEGTTPKPENFAQFIPILDATGRISGLRFVFPPYQVGPYSDGTQTVDVPATVLLPHVAPEYADLFSP